MKPAPSRTPHARLVRPGARALIALCALASPALADDSDATFHWIDGLGRETAALQAGDTLVVRVDGLTPRTGYDLVLRSDEGAVLGLARIATDVSGTLGPEVLWWESGVTGPDPAGTGRGGHGFQTFAEAESFLAEHAIAVEVRAPDLDEPGSGQLLADETVPVVAPRSAPLLWFGDGETTYRTAFEAGDEDVYVTGEGLPAGAIVDLFVVRDRASYSTGDALVDVTGYGGSAHPKRVYLAADSTSFSIPAWPAAYQRAGRFDLVARVNDDSAAPRPEFENGDLVVGGLETGLHVRRPSSGLGPSGGPQDIETEIAGRKTFQGIPPGYRFQDVFLRHAAVRAALDPTDVPPEHPGGDYASTWVVKSRKSAKWHSSPAIGPDLTETVEYRQMKPGTLELSIGLIWSDANPAKAEEMRCDVVLDFDDDGIYDPGLDVIDRLDAHGLTIVDDPSDPGPYPVGRTEYDFVDAYDIPWGDYRDQNVDVRAVVAYPGETAGTDVPVYGKNKEYPLVVILHGNHIVCTDFGCTCPPSRRVPNHKGYDYLLDLWASQGFIAVSIDGYDITGCPIDRFIERGALILEHLNYWKRWNDRTIPDDTFDGRFYSRVLMKRIGIAGHSRGGEGVAAAVQINRDLALGFDIRAAILIAPTDYNWSAPPGGGPIEFVIEDTPVFNIMGSSDGDVFDVEGAQLWDRASPVGYRADKSQAFVYGADHNSWNTVWIDPSWNGGSDGVGGNRITAQQQQDTGRVYMTSWWMAWLQDRREMLAFHTNTIDSSKLSGVNTYWSYESAEHVDVDHFEDAPTNKALNSLGGDNTASPNPLTWIESSFEPGAYDGSFFQDTRGAIVAWNKKTDYVAEIPDGFGDVTAYSHLAIRVAQIWDDLALNKGGSQRFLVDVEDDDGRRAVVEVDTRAFDRIPVGYNHPWTGRKSMLSSVRVPLRAFTQDNSNVDLTRVRKVILTFDDTGLLAIDDLQFSK
jgi:hypothetical protein